MIIDLTKEKHPCFKVLERENETLGKTNISLTRIYLNQSFTAPEAVTILFGKSSSVMPIEIGTGTFLGKAVHIGQGVKVGESCQLARNSRVFFLSSLGNNVKLDKYALVLPECNIGNNVHMFQKSEIGLGTNIGAGCQINRAVVKSGISIPAKVFVDSRTNSVVDQLKTKEKFDNSKISYGLY